MQRNEFYCNRIYRKFLKKELSKMNYDILINSQYSRDYTCEEVVKMVNAKEKICMHGDNYNLCEYQRARYDLNYTRVIKNASAKNMYLVRTNELLQSLTGTEYQIDRPEIRLKSEKFAQIDFDWNMPYVIMFPFARTSERILKIEAFVELAEYLFNRHNLVTYFCGSNDDATKVQKINRNFIKNICGKYSLAQLPYIFNKAKLVLSNDTMAVHLASGVNDNVICFSNGKFIVNKQLHSIKNNAGKEIFFFDEPYKGVKTICPTKLYDDIQKNIFDYESNFFESSYDINGINIDNTKNIIDYILSVR